MVGVQPPTTMTTTTSFIGGTLYCAPIDHFFEKFDKSSIYCRKCGTVRDVEAIRKVGA